MPDQRRSLPSVDRLVARPEVAEVARCWARRTVVSAAREILDEARAAALSGGEALGAAQLAAELARRLTGLESPRPRRVINATGVIVHTNLGRAPLSQAALRELQHAASGYSALELDLASGARGDRHAHVAGLLSLLFPGARALVVNNNAAALVLALNTLARGRDVVISRGELVEIGGSFRVPEILERSGARLLEVGTTNRTHLRDYEAALGTETGMILRVWPSNYRVIGFTKEVPLKELVRIGRGAHLPVVVDQGCGRLHQGAPGPASEVSVAELLAAGANLVCFSGDKLLGGPQAGILVGDPQRIAACSANPLARALRPGKLTLAALAATLRAWLRPQGHVDSLPPVAAMLEESEQRLAERADGLRRRLAALTPRIDVSCTAGVSRIGGGAAPGEELPTTLVRTAVSGLSENRLLQALRSGDPPIVARIDGGAVVLDPRTLRDDEEQDIVAAYSRIATEQAS